MQLFYLEMLKDEEEKNEFMELYEKYVGLMYYVADSYIKDKGLSEDAVQTAFCRIINNFSKISGFSGHKMKAYIVVVVENSAKDVLMSRKKFVFTDFKSELTKPLLSDKGRAVEEAEEQISDDLLLEKIETLPKRERDALVLRYFMDFDNKQVAGALQISEAAARKRVQRARAMFFENFLDGGSKNEPEFTE
jgi:RNA polymerase sigma-70 factor (ECF subfamily)